MIKLENMTIFDLMYEKYKITKPVRLIELFSGYGSQALALKYLGVNFEHWKTCEWAIKSIQAYKDIHFTDEIYNSNLTKEEYVNYLYKKGISSNYNEPMTYEQIKRINEKQLKTIYDNIQITHNLVNIQQVKGKDLDIVDTDKFTYLLTYSFPCVLAGTKIITNNGYKNVEDVEKGDMVLTHNNRFKKVVKTMKKISNHYYKIKGVGVNDLLLTGEHPLYVERNGSFQWIKVKDLTTNDYFTFNVNNHSTRGYKDYGYDLWLLGRYVADGYINKRLYNSVEFAIGLNKKDEFEKHITNKFKKCLSSKSCYQYRIADKDFQDKCKEFGNGALNKKIPQWVIDLPKEQLQEFFDGYMSGDGHIRKRNNTTQAMFCTVSKELYLGLQQIIMKLYGCVCSCYVRHDNRKRTFNDSYNCQFNIENIHRFQHKIEDKIATKITKIEKIDKDTIVYNFEVEDDNSYTCDNVIVHNCQDLSLSGKGKGMSDTSTRSGMLWEVERILTECKELGNLPQILVMENVPQVHSQDNIKDFNKWQLRLEELGYNNYCQDLIATDYGIPQTRNRCFMVSILGEYNYTFPKPIPLKLKLKDILEENADEKYFLSDKMINFFKNNEIKQKNKGNGFKFNISNGNAIAKTITTRSGSRMDDNFIVVPEISCDVGVVAEPKIVDDRDININGITLNDICPTQRATRNGLKVLQTDLRIRKLSPLECWRLMGVKDEDYEKVKQNQSDSSLYHLAGDSLVTTVMMAIMGELFNVNWQNKLTK